MRDRNRKGLKIFIAMLLAVIVAAGIAFGVYAGIYYHADGSVDAYLTADDGQVTIAQTKYGWFLDGPSEENAMVFYPGAKVEAKAYIPILDKFAEAGMDVCLVKMPFNLAIFGQNKASKVIGQYDYENWYVGGHSLGGAMSAAYAAKHSDQLKGVILLAAYATEKLDDSLVEIVLYGSEDRVLRSAKIVEGREFAPERYYEYEIEGGNHAQFGNYGEQSGDGISQISAEEQQNKAVSLVMESIEEKTGAQ